MKEEFVMNLGLGEKCMQNPNEGNSLFEGFWTRIRLSVHPDGAGDFGITRVENA